MNLEAGEISEDSKKMNWYKLAAYEVYQWYEENGTTGLSQLISQLNDDTDFSYAYEKSSN